MNIEACVFQIRDSQGKVRGTGFAISPDLIVTCSHVVDGCKGRICELLGLSLYPKKTELKDHGKIKLEAEVLSDGWNDEQDVAFLRLLSSLPLNTMHMGERLGSFNSTYITNRTFSAFGYPNLVSDCEGFWAQGLILGQIRNYLGAIRLQLKSQDITFGMSGAPIIDEESELIVGMVLQTNIPNATGKFRDLAYALPIETISKLSPEKLNVNSILRQPPLHPVNMAQDPENGFIMREREYKQLIEGLLNNQNDTAVKTTISLYGTGGCGKTTLAKTICHDPDIQKKFSNIILWVTLGQNPRSLIGHIQDLIYRLIDKRPKFEGLDAAASYLKDLLRGKCLLLVIDDLWDSSHLEPFIQGGPDCVRLITTRIKEVLPEGTLEIRVDMMKNEEATKLLQSGLSNTNNQAIEELAKRLGYWPLLLKMVNSALKQHIKGDKSFEEAIDHVKHELDRKNLTAFDLRNPQKRNQAVKSTISVSFDLLDENELERYKELAIFPADVEIHMKTVERLWRKLAEYDYFAVKDLCYKFFNMSLLQTYDKNKEVIKLHDVMREYLNDMEQPKIYLTHSQFLEAYKIETWVDLPKEEKYLWENLAYHLVGAGRKTELRKLLLDFNWIQSKLDATNINFLLNDYDLFFEDYAIEMVKGAIRLSANALSKDKKMLEGQLLGHLQSISNVEIRFILDQILKNRKETRVLPLTNSLVSPDKALLHSLAGHFNSISAISITPDGKYAVSASLDRTLKVWDIKTGKEVYTLKGHYSLVNAVCVTPDGRYAVSASADKTLKVWDLTTGKEVRTLTGHSSSVLAVFVTPDGNYIVSASNDRTFKVWDLKTGTKVRTLIGHTCWITFSITPDGNYAISTSPNDMLKIWDLNTGQEIHNLTGYSSSIDSTLVTSDEDYDILTSSDNRLEFGDLKTRQDVLKFSGYSSPINAISVTSDGNYAVSVSSDNTLKVWDLKTGEEVRTLTGHSDWVNAVCVTPDGRYAISASSDRTLKIWDIKTGKVIRTLTGHYSLVNAVSITPDGNHVVSASSDSTLKVWNVKTGKQVSAFSGESPFSSVVFSTDSTFIVAGDISGRMHFLLFERR